MGSYHSEELAARVYDIYAIKSYGNKARTNFVYNYYQLKKIRERKINIKSNNISDFVKQLIDWKLVYNLFWFKNLVEINKFLLHDFINF